MRSFVVIGLGSFGYSVALNLSLLGHEVLVISDNEDMVNKISGHVTSAIIGDATDEDVLKSLGVANFDAAVVAIGENIKASILITLNLKDLGVNFVVAKAGDTMHAKVLSKVGADKVVNVEGEMGIRIARSLVSENFFDYLELSKDYSIIEILSPQKWAGKTIKDIDIRAKYSLNVIAIKTEEGINVSPTALDIINEGNVLVMLGSNDKINSFNEGI
jgi:trk system potassium uptake protein TrkA